MTGIYSLTLHHFAKRRIHSFPPKNLKPKKARLRPDLRTCLEPSGERFLKNDIHFSPFGTHLCPPFKREEAESGGFIH